MRFTHQSNKPVFLRSTPSERSVGAAGAEASCRPC